MVKPTEISRESLITNTLRNKSYYLTEGRGNTHTFMSLMPSLLWKCLPTSQPNHTAWCQKDIN